jgi:inner membrane protein
MWTSTVDSRAAVVACFVNVPSIFTHAFAALALGKASASERRPARFWWLTVLCAVLPDADAVSFALGVERGSQFSHRGITHSLLFALLVACAVVSFAFKKTPRFSKSWWVLLLYFFAVTTSHGLLDALTDGGSGVAFFAPFDTARYFFPWRPIEVSPIGFRFFSARGVDVFMSEFVWVWLPAILLVASALVYRRLRAHRNLS